MTSKLHSFPHHRQLPGFCSNQNPRFPSIAGGLIFDNMTVAIALCAARNNLVPAGTITDGCLLMAASRPAERYIVSRAFECCLERADTFGCESGHIVGWRNLAADERIKARRGDASAWSRRPAVPAHPMSAIVPFPIGSAATARRAPSRARASAGSKIGAPSRQVAAGDHRGRGVRGRTFNRRLYVSCMTVLARQIDWRWLPGAVSNRTRHSAQRSTGG